MSAPDASSTRASLEVARVALGRMTGAPAAAGAHRPSVTMATRAREAWASVENLLRATTGRADLTGQALLAEARRVDALDVDGLHALIALHEWVERTVTPGSAAHMLTLSPTEAEAEVATTALVALERAIGGGVIFNALALPAEPSTTARSPWAPQPVGDAVENVNVVTPKAPSEWAPSTAPKPIAPPPPTLRLRHQSSNGTTNDTSRADASRVDIPEAGAPRSMSSGLIMGILVMIVAIGSTGLFFYFKGRSPDGSATEQGVAAYARGAKEAARIAFAKAVQENPDDARALTYLGRISREQGSTATARQYLERAIRVDPNSALASRELGSALLADQQFELARRFYVRALTIDPSDRIAQGFLGCALFKLNRIDEAQRWMDRAGTGEWSACAPAPIAAPSKD